MNTSRKRRGQGLPGHAQTVAKPGKPKSSGYAEPNPKTTPNPDQPDPDVPGDESSQSHTAGEGDVEYPTDDSNDDSPPRSGAGENIEYPSEASPLDGL